MVRQPVSVEEFREAQEILKEAMDLHENKDFSSAIESFKKAAMISPFNNAHLEELQKKLKEGTYKLQQESIAYMGCAAVHVSQLVKELTDEQREEVPVDENLIKAFNDWDN
jgi:anti-sigma28 factor (negative regulator of flagellin synthesis)